MAYDFVVIIKRPDYKRLDIISLLMLFFAVIFFIYNGLRERGGAEIIFFIISFYILICCFLNIDAGFRQKKIVDYKFPLGVCCFTFIFANINFITYILSALFLIAGIFEGKAKTPLEVCVDKSGIVFNSVPKKKSSWNELNNVVIKDGLITVDYKNNKLFQKEIETTLNQLSENNFNEFCKQQLSKA